MKRSLICALLTVALGCGGTALYAEMQSAVPGHGGANAHQMPPVDQRLQFLTKTLNLTPDQQQKIKPILESEAEQLDAVQQDATLSQQDRWSKMRQIRQSMQEQIKPILTADQQKKWQQMHNEHAESGAHYSTDHGVKDASPAPLAPADH
jgi:Spy/CpxP family protein refolding chaperone